MKTNSTIVKKFTSKYRKFIFIIIFILISLSAIFLFYSLIINKQIKNELELTTQQTMKYVRDSEQYTIPENIQNLWAKHFKKRFFSPWTDPFRFSKENDILAVERSVIKKFSAKPGWGLNRHKISTEEFKKISNNIQFEDGFNTKKPAITTRITSLRLLPTHLPSFTNWTDPGEGFPFDNYQITSLHLNLPIFVLHTTQDKAWSLVITPNKSYGWVKNNDIVMVNDNFISSWIDSKFIVATKERTALLDERNIYQGLMRIGNLHPLIAEKDDNYVIKFAYSTKDSTAGIKQVIVKKKKAEIWPISAKTKYVAYIANEYLGQPYGWGGFMELHDCSSILMDLFANFAIWLPKYSGDQVYEGEYVDLKELSKQEKEKIIKERGKPFFTLLWKPGHIVLYIGHDKQNIYIFHTIWGLRTHTLLGKDGRAIIGKTVITSLNFGSNNPVIKKTLLQGISGMVLIDDKPERLE